VLLLENMIGDSAHAFLTTWREKQLEYPFRRGKIIKRRYCCGGFLRLQNKDTE
jgi:hypothetical protein